MIKILHIVNRPEIGGIEWFVYYLVKEQERNPDIEVSVLFCNDHGKLKYQFISSNINCYFLNIDILGLRDYVKLIKITKGYDLIHIHSFVPIRDYLLMLFKRRIIYTIHSVFGYGRNNNIKTKIKRYLFKKYINNKNIYLSFNSSYTKKFWRSKGIININTKIIYNGVKFKKPKNPLLKEELKIKDKFIVGTTSRLIKWKRVDLLLQAFNNFATNKDDVALLIVGDGSERKMLESMAKSSTNKENIIFTGYMVNVEDYQQVMDVCVFPSTTEAFGLVAVECLHLGKPVIVFRDGGGITEIINKIEPENVINTTNALTERLEHYYINRKYLVGQYSEARKDYSRGYNMSISEKRFYTYYKEILTNSLM